MNTKETFLNKLIKIWVFFRGDVNTLSLESRLFNTLSLIVLITFFLEIFINLYLNLLESALISLAVVVLHSIIYYLFRYKQKLRFAIILSGIQANLLLGINYFINGGINGPSLLLFLTVILMLMVISNHQHIWIWLLINIIVVNMLLFIEYSIPDSVIDYRSKSEMFSDLLVSYLTAIILVATCVFYLKDTYLKQRKTLEAQALSLRKSNEEKDKLFSIISHDLRGPLASVQQYLSFMTDIDLEPNERTALEANLIKTTNNAQEMLTNLLQWSKRQLDGNQIHLQELAIKTVLISPIKMIENAAEIKSIILDIKIEENLCAYADEDMLQLVVRNLLNNALKFTPSGGLIKLAANKNNNECLIVITDNGIGISPEKQKHIFSLKAKSTLGTNNEKGTGIGLMLCKEYANSQGGNIWFKSQEGKGTSFFLSLPLKPF